MEISKPTPEGRVRCAKGHLIGKRAKTFCIGCYNSQWCKTEKGRANQYRSNHSAKGRAKAHRYWTSEKGHLNSSKRAYKKLLQTGSWAIVNMLITPGSDEAKTQHRFTLVRACQRKCSAKHRKRWGRIDRNPLHRHRWEQIREGQWREDEHPL